MRHAIRVYAALSIAAGLLLALGAGAAAQTQIPPFPGFDEYVERLMADWEVPGLAVAVVRGDSVVFARGYGLREIGTGDRVDENTVFAIASITKSFTSAGVGMLVDEGRLAWDDRAAAHLPKLEFGDPWVTRVFTVRDMLSHRSGLERGDWLWFGTEYDRDDVVHHIRYLNPVGGFRAVYGYSNNMYIAAGQMIAALTGASWDDFTIRRIFQPLGMTRSNTSVRHLAGMENVAMPHEKVDGRMRRVPHGNLDNEAPGGAINSSVMDMTQWIRLQLGGGTVDGRTLIQQATLEETQTPQTLIPITDAHRKSYPDIHFLTYGLGWEILNYRGERLVQHSGAFDGMRSRMAMVPDQRLGFIILTNRGWGNASMDVLRNAILDAYLGAPPHDWNTAFLTRIRGDEESALAYERRVEAERIPGTRPSLPLTGYAGRYADDAFGPATVTEHDGRLAITLGPRHTGDLEHWHHNTFRAVWRGPTMGWSLVTFDFAHDGSITQMHVGGVRTYRRVGDQPGG
jgi:CubicO group peptidase (beta-lactamase class C family)